MVWSVQVLQWCGLEALQKEKKNKKIEQFSFKRRALCNIFFTEIMWSFMTSYMTQTLNRPIILVDLILIRFLQVGNELSTASW